MRLRLSIVLGAFLTVLLGGGSVWAQLAYVQPVWQAGATELTSNPSPAPTRFASFVLPDDGAAFVTGRLNFPSGGQPCFAVWKVDAGGGVVWTTPLANPNLLDCYGVCVTATAPGDYVFAAGVLKGTKGKDLLVVGLDSLGAVRWQTIYDNTLNGVYGDDVPVVIKVRVVDGVPHVYIGGNSQSGTQTANTLGFDYIVLKLNGNTGTSLWGTEGAGFPRPFRYNGPGGGDDILADMVIPPGAPGGIPAAVPDPERVLLAGTSYGGALTNNDWATLSISNTDPFNPADPALMVRTTLAGNEVATSIDAKYNLMPTPAVLLSVFVGGYSDTGPNADNDFRTTAYGPALEVVCPTCWTRTYNGTGNKHDMVNKVRYDRFVDTLFTSGDSWGGTAQGFNIATIAYNPGNGNSLWTPEARVFNHPVGSAEDRMLDLIADKFGNSYVVGKSFNGTTFDLVPVSYTISGTVRWLEGGYSPPPPGGCVGTLTGRDYVQYDGTASGDDAGATIRLASGEDYDHLGDVIVFGTALTNGPGGTHVQRYIVNRYRQCDR